MSSAFSGEKNGEARDRRSVAVCLRGMCSAGASRCHFPEDSAAQQQGFVHTCARLSPPHQQPSDDGGGFARPTLCGAAQRWFRHCGITPWAIHYAAGSHQQSTYGIRRRASASAFQADVFLWTCLQPQWRELYASVASLFDSEGKSAGDTGSGIAVYSLRDGRLSPSRFLKIPPQKIPEGKKFPSKSPIAKDLMIPYPAGLAVLPASEDAPERLLVAGNLSDQVWLLDAKSGASSRRLTSAILAASGFRPPCPMRSPATASRQPG